MGNRVRISEQHNCADYLDSQYVSAFRVDYTTSQWLLSQCESHIRKETTRFRSPLLPGKQLAIALQWMATGATEVHLANEYFVGSATVHNAIHEVIEVLGSTLLHDSIKFPVGQKLGEAIGKFEAISGMKGCAGALDGTFMRIRKADV